MFCAVCGKKINPAVGLHCVGCWENYCAACAGSCGLCACGAPLNYYS